MKLGPKKKNIFQLSSQVKDHVTDIKSSVSTLDWLLIEKYVSCENQIFRDSTEKTHDKKLLALGINRRLSPVDPNEVIFNFSKIVVPSRIRYLLAYGLDFSLPIFKLDFIEYYFSLKNCYTLVCAYTSRFVIVNYT